MGFFSGLAQGLRGGKVRGDATNLMRKIVGEYQIPSPVQDYLTDYTTEHSLGASNVPEVAVLGLLHYHDLGTKDEGKGLLLQRIVEWLRYAETNDPNVIPAFCREMVLERIIEHNDWCVSVGQPVKGNLQEYLRKHQ